MSQDGHAPGSIIPELPCGCPVYRGARSRRWFDEEGRPKRTAFLRRKIDTDGLSVALIDWFPQDESDLAAHIDSCTGLRECHGLLSMLAGRIRNLGLDVVPDKVEVGHASITGVPYNDGPEADPPQALLWAGRLQGLCWWVRWYRRPAEEWLPIEKPLVRDTP